MNVPEAVVCPSSSRFAIPSTTLIGIMRRGVGEGAGITRKVWSVLDGPAGILVPAVEKDR